MAKFANVTYGLHGGKKQYTYVVNDKTRAGDIIHPSVKHHRSGKIFGTTGIVQSAVKDKSKTGEQMKSTLERGLMVDTDRYGMVKFDAHGNVMFKDPTKVVEYEKLNAGNNGLAKAERNEITGQFVKSNGVGRAVKENGVFTVPNAPTGNAYQASKYSLTTRGLNIQNRLASEKAEGNKPEISKAHKTQSAVREYENYTNAGGEK